MSLKTQLILSALLLVGVVLSAASIFLYFSESQHLRKQLDRKQVESIRRLYTVCQEGVLSDNELVTARYIKQISVLPEVYCVMCMDAKGQVRAVNDPSVAERLPASPSTG